MAVAVDTHLEKGAFLDAIRRRLVHCANIGEAVAYILDRATLDPTLAAELLHRGAVDFASDVLTRTPRDRILKVVSVRRIDGTPDVRHVQVERSALRDWPIRTVHGYRPVESCTPEEIDEEVGHIDRTITGLYARRHPLAAVAKAARDRGLSVCGELPDAVLDACLTEGT